MRLRSMWSKWDSGLSFLPTVSGKAGTKLLPHWGSPQAHEELPDICWGLCGRERGEGESLTTVEQVSEQDHARQEGLSGSPPATGGSASPRLGSRSPVYLRTLLSVNGLSWRVWEMTYPGAGAGARGLERWVTEPQSKAPGPAKH